jgi:hypothetical protein
MQKASDDVLPKQDLANRFVRVKQPKRLQTPSKSIKSLSFSLKYIDTQLQIVRSFPSYFLSPMVLVFYRSHQLLLPKTLIACSAASSSVNRLSTRDGRLDRHTLAPVLVKERSNIWLLNNPTENGYLLSKDCQGRPEATEEYEKAIGLQHHSQDRPPDDNKEETDAKRDGSLIILTLHEELHGRLEANG